MVTSMTADQRRLATAAMLAAAALLYLPGLGDLDLWAPDEPRFAQVAEELRSMEHGPEGLVVLHLNGAVYTQKPPLYYWMAAAVGAAFGQVNEWAARLPSAAAGLGVIALTLRFGRDLFGPTSRAGLWGAAILLGVLRFSHLARRAQLDVLLTLFETAALVAFWRLEGQGLRSESERRRTLLWLHAALGLAVLTKGPVGLLPLLGIAVYLAWEGRLRDMRRYVPAWSLALSIGPAVAWLAAAVALTPAGYFGDAVVDNVLQRFFSGTSHVRPFYYYAYQFPLDFLPWTLLWPAALATAVRGARAGGRATRPFRLLLAWTATLVLFFSFSAGKRGLYLLPAFPAMALLCGAALDALLERRALLPGWIRAALAIGALALAGAGGWIALAGGLRSAALPGFEVSTWFGVALSGLALLALGLGRGRSATTATGIAAAFAVGLQLAFFGLLLPGFDNEKSPRPIAEAARRATPPGEPIAVFDHRPLVAGIAYYTGGRVTEIADPEGVKRFLAAGGRTLICRAQHEKRLRGVANVEVAARLRHGRRELVVLRVAPTAASLPAS